MPKRYNMYLFLSVSIFLYQGCAKDTRNYEVSRISQNAVINNGVKLNGVKLNGVKLNGVKLNGVKLNGVKLNGVKLNGTVLEGTTDDGTLMIGSDFIGTDLDAVLEDGTEVVLQITHMEESLDTPGLEFYEVKYHDGVDWVNICEVNDLAIAVDGTWNEFGDHVPSETSFSFSCRGTAVAKCIEWGFPLWATQTECLDDVGCQEQSLAAFHQACTRMVRADYCGDGVAHTENGTTIDIWDALDIMTETPDSGLNPEAEWQADGATCIVQTRWREQGGNAAKDYILNNCPERWVGTLDTNECFSAESDFFTEHGYDVPAEWRSVLRNSTGDNLR